MNLVTVREFKLFLGQSGYDYPAKLLEDQVDQDPIRHVSQVDALAYCAHTGMHLPSEEEWIQGREGQDGKIGFPLAGLYEITGTLDGGYAVLRGGSWLNLRDLARCTDRDRFNPAFRDYFIGFRCSRKAVV